VFVVFVMLTACPGAVIAARSWQVAAMCGPPAGWQTGQVTDDRTSTVRGDAELIARAGHLFDMVHEEFVCAARDLATWSQPEARSAVARRVLATGVDGLQVRKLWSPRVLADEAQRAHLRRLGAAGAQVRISSAPLPHETIILDRRVAILAGQPSPIGREYTVTTSPVLVGGVYSLFTAAWEAATDLGAYLRGEVPELAPGEREILRALGAGLTDEAAARRLGTSLRTYRRRVAELMATLEAGSRFQAGVRAGELGLAH
jgi:DNA-binding NarL/FixJ family response regulator